MTRHAGGDCAEDGNCRALVEAGTPVVTLVGKSSTLHVDRVLRTSRDENLHMIADSVTHFKALGKEVIYDAEHFFDGYRSEERRVGKECRSRGARDNYKNKTIYVCNR